MKSVIERLDDIENTARSIVAKAEEDKSQVEQEIQAQRDQFDKPPPSCNLSDQSHISSQNSLKNSHFFNDFSKIC